MTKPDGISQCQNPEVGRFIGHYEMGLLRGSELLDFEEHLLECDHCFGEVAAQSDLSLPMQRQRQALMAALREDGRDFESIHANIHQSKRAQLPNRVDPRVKIRRLPFITMVIKPRVFAPAVVAVAAVILLLIVLHRPVNPYLSLLDRRAPQDEIGLLRGTSNEFYAQGLDAYNRARYHEAARQFEKFVQQAPDHAMGWFYLGISHYLDNRAQPALEALQHAEQLTPDGSQKILTRWYLAQIYLLNRQPAEATHYLEQLASTDNAYSTKARDLLTKLQALQP